MAETSIEWTTQRYPDGRVVPGYTANGWSGCTKHVIPGAGVDPACIDCYAEREEDKRRHRSKWGPGRPRTEFKYWREALPKWNAAALRDGVRPFVFGFSLGDWADTDRGVPDGLRDEFFGYVDRCRYLVFLMLTKRADEAAEYLMRRYRGGLPPNLWLGVSAVTVAGVLWRAPIALDVPAAVRFVSAEPLVENIAADPAAAALLARFDWIITGGRTGTPSDIAQWVAHSSSYRSLRDLAAQHGRAYHFKQWGNFAPLHESRAGVTGGIGVLVSPDGRRNMVDIVTDHNEVASIVTAHDAASELHHYLGGSRGAHAHGRTLDGVEHNAFPEVTV